MRQQMAAEADVVLSSKRTDVDRMDEINRKYSGYHLLVDRLIDLCGGDADEARRLIHAA
jgi:hypothetical protein